MKYEEKIEYAEPVVIEKRLMQQLIDPGTDVRPLDAKAAEKFLAEYEVLRFENPLETSNLQTFRRRERNRMRHGFGSEEGNHQRD